MPPAGRALTAAHATSAFIGKRSVPDLVASAASYREAAATLGPSIDVYTVTNLVLGRTLAEAGASLRRDASRSSEVWFGSRPEPLDPSMLADRFTELWESGLDGILCSASDWSTDLALMETEVLPELRRRGVVADRAVAAVG